MRVNFKTGLGIALVGLVCGAALLSLFWLPNDPMRIVFGDRLRAPSLRYLLGADEFGRDVLTRLMVGGATSVWISLLTVTLAVICGATIGLLSGYVRGWTDRILMAMNDALLAFPGILLALGLLAVIGPSKYGIVLALSIAYTPSVARIVRGSVLSIREREFVDASVVMGNSGFTTVARHILPNCLAPIAVFATSMCGYVLLAESALSFLGLGVPPPAPTWGNMLASARPFMSQAPWLAIYPGLCISLTLLGINLLGDALRDRLDPHMRGVR